MKTAALLGIGWLLGWYTYAFTNVLQHMPTTAIFGG